MKLLIITLIFAFTFLYSKNIALANSSSVKINNQVNVLDTNNSSQTDIRIETNGEVLEYHSDEPNQKIEVKATNSDSSINIDGTLISESASKEAKAQKSDSVKNENNEEVISQSENFTEYLTEKFNFLEKLFSFLGLL